MWRDYTIKELYQKNLKKYMQPHNARTGLARRNPKMHKENHPMRMTVSMIDNPTHIIADIAEKQLRSHVEKLPSYVKDTTPFFKRLESLKHNLPENTILFCMDVKSLYPSVPRKETLQACQKALDNRLDKSIPSAEVLNMISIVLENNYFTFVDKNYKQNNGTANRI